MQIFVTGTGRCGTSTFYHACRHISNYTCTHESQAGTVPHHDYPDRHIEVSSQLTIFMGILLDRYQDSLWVHLIREREDCIRSLQRQTWDLMNAFAFAWCQTTHPADTYDAAAVYYDSVNSLIPKLAPNALTVKLESPGEGFSEFWRQIEAEGDFTAAMEEWSRKYNPGVNRGRDNWI